MVLLSLDCVDHSPSHHLCRPSKDSSFVAADYTSKDGKGTANANVNLCKTPLGLFPCKSESKPKPAATKPSAPKKKGGKYHETVPKAHSKPKQNPKPKQDTKPKPHPKQEAKPAHKQEAKVN